MKTMKMLALAAVLFGATTAANAATAFLATDDFVGISFWLISMGMLAATAFFFMEQANVGSQWRKSVNVAGLVTVVTDTLKQNGNIEKIGNVNILSVSSIIATALTSMFADDSVSAIFMGENVL